MQDFHETWLISFEFEHAGKYQNFEGLGFYESYDAKENLVRCGILPQVLYGVSKMNKWNHEIKWTIRIPFIGHNEEYWMRIYKQKLKRHHKTHHKE